ncbi:MULTISPECIES: hypothetical protein [unclassified Flavobacterium]|jgi:hypothetical protein|uniref:hypothetical protein n=1 Tax=unclassified Flavobacterium TaxID=196869 RepID=UPI0025BDE7AA|nr:MULTISPECIES: hypothetical protein [unclassified Flavobacterium]
MIQSVIKYCKSSLLILILFFAFSGNNAYSQKEKKSVSLSIQYSKIMKENSFLNITAKTKGENGFEPCSNLNFTVYKIDTTGVAADIKIGEVKTSTNGKAKFIIPAKFIEQSTAYKVKSENDKTYDDADESVTITDINIEASIEKADSSYTIKAKLLSATNKPIAEESLNIGLKRLFGNLSVGGESSYTTDADGAVTATVEKGYTGLNGKLNFQVVLPESEKYGTVIANINTAFGVPIVDKSTFNERTMWSPPTKIPIFLLIIPNILIIGIWSTLVLLLFNLYKIYKSKN